MNRTGITVGVIAGVLLATTASAQSPGTSDDWRYALTPYLWLPTISGDTRYETPPGSGIGSPTVDVGPADWIDLLNYGLLVGGSAQKGRFSLFADVIYLSLTSDDNDRVVSVDDAVTTPGIGIPVPIAAELNTDTKTDLDGLLWTATAGYDLSRSDDGHLTVFAGARYLDIDVATRWELTAEISVPGGGVIFPRAGRLSGSSSLLDGLVGIRGEFSLSDGRWSAPFYLDYGSGDSDRTWNAFAGVVRQFDWGDLLIAYRHLEYDQDDGSLLQDFSFSGPAFGARFTF